VVNFVITNFIKFSLLGKGTRRNWKSRACECWGR